MPEGEKKVVAKIAIWFLIIISLIVITQSFIKYYVNKDFLSVDRIYCMNNEENCFAPDVEDEDPYKVIIFDRSTTLTCTEKDELCDIENICGVSSSEECKILDCTDDLNILPKGYATSEQCFEEQ